MSTEQPQPTPEKDVQLHYQQLMASIDGIFWEADRQTFQFTYISEQAERLLGYPVAQWLTPDFWVEHIHPDDRDWAPRFCTLAISEQRNHSFEYRMLAADGRIVWLRDVVSVGMEGGHATKLRGLMVDVTDRKQAEEERKAYLWFLESMDKVNRAMQGTNELEQLMSDVLDTVLTIFDCDRAWLLYPCDPSAPTWCTPMERTRPQYPGAYARQSDVPMTASSARLFQAVLETEGPVQFGPAAQYGVSPETATQFGVKSAIAMAIYPKLTSPYIFGLHQCLQVRMWTPQEERLLLEIGRRLADALNTLFAYQRLQESELRYREVFENTSELIAITEVSTEGHLRLLDFNPAWEAVLGIKRDLVIGRLLEDFPAHSIAKYTLDHYRACLQTKAPLHYEEQLVTPTGEWYMDNTLIPICDAVGQVYRVVGVGRNITEQKRAEAELRASEARFRTFVDHATDAFFLHDKGGKILDLNRQAAEYLGYTREELIGITPTTFDANLTDADLTQLQARIDSGEVLIFEARHRHKNGTILPVEVSIRSFKIGDQLFSVSLTRDITERKRVQEALTLFRSLIDRSNDIVEVIDPQTGRFLDVNEQACVIHGYTRAEYLTLMAADINPEIARKPWAEIIAKLQQAGSCVYESQHRRQDGTTFPVEIQATYIRLDRDYLVAVVRDINVRKQTEAALKASEERYRTLYDDNPSMYFTLDQAGTILSVNHFGAEHLGYTIAELTDRLVLDLFYAADQAAAAQALQQCVEQPGQVFHWSLRKVHKNGTVLWVEEAARAISRMDGSLMVLVVCEDISERKRTEQALVESHNLLNAIVEGTDDCVFVKDLQGRYLMMNRAGAKLIGRQVEEVVGNDDFVLFDAQTAQRFQDWDRQIMATAETQMIEETEANVVLPRTFLTAKNAYRNADGAVVGLIGISREITELKRLEEQLRQAQKMEALGRLAGGVAHDFNNLLTVINGYSHLIFSRLPTDDANRPLLAEIKKAGERAAGLTRQLLAFSRKQILQPQVVNLNTLLTELIELLRRLIGEHIELVLQPAPTLGLTKLDPGQFEQAIINLAVNARDAMPQGGRLTIETCNTMLDATYTEHHSEVSPGQYVCIAMHDTGVGMDDVTKARIFEPFFTTKGPGQGTGLGLAMIYGFVKQSDGHIEVFSKPEQGTTFKLYLPLTETLDSKTKVARAEKDGLGGTETVLLVEDEASVRELVSDILCAHGYHVLEAAGPEKGLTLAATYDGPIDLLVTDVIMPHMNGRKLSQQLVAARADLKVLYMSGYTENVIADHDLMANEIAFLQKPFTVDGLLKKVRALLD